MIDLDQSFKLFSFIPPIYNYLVTHFSNIEITPDNDLGKHVFFSPDKKNFFVKNNFFIKTYTNIQLLDVSILYRETRRPILKKIIEIDNNLQQINGSYELINPHTLQKGYLSKLFISTTFLCDEWESNHGSVRLAIRYSVPSLPGVKMKEFDFYLGENGVLEPNKTLKRRIN